MLLGDLMARFATEDGAAAVLQAFGDPILAARIDEAATPDSLSRGEFIINAIGHFACGASNDDWVCLIGNMGKTDDPAYIFLKTTVEWALNHRLA